MKLIFVCVVALLSIACTWVKPLPGSAEVALVKPAHTQNCTKVGAVYANTTNRILGIHRSTKKVNDELLVLAKKEAHTLGGDTLVALGPVIEGKQRFDAYQCL